jgi:hypothetical protein
MNLKEHGIRKELVLYFNWYPGIFFEGLKKTTEKLGQNSWSPGEDSDPSIPNNSEAWVKLTCCIAGNVYQLYEYVFVIN